ncbi:MAG: hypothetical protein ACRC0G_09695 [Fusobacteriaceae bacterium]
MIRLINRKDIQELLDNKAHFENVLICVEELSELQKEITKMERGSGTFKSLAEEMADVYIVLEMIKEIYDIEEEFVVSEIKRKMERNIDRIK